MPEKRFFLICIAAAFLAGMLCSCSLFVVRPFNPNDSAVSRYFPHNRNARFTYRITLDDKVTERVFQWKGADEAFGKKVHILTDSKGAIKAYQWTPREVHLRGISIQNQMKPTYYKGDNACLAAPLIEGHGWRIRAFMETETTKIRQTGMARVEKVGKCRVEAGEFDAVKIFYDITAEYQVKKTGEKSSVLAQYSIWYGEGIGALKQTGTSFIEKENRVIHLEQELIKFETREFGKTREDKSSEETPPPMENPAFIVF